VSLSAGEPERRSGPRGGESPGITSRVLARDRLRVNLSSIFRTQQYTRGAVHWLLHPWAFARRRV